MAEIDPRRCPLCGGPNACGVADQTGTCWCFAMDIPAEVKARVPSEARDVACVCRPCSQGRPNPANIAAQIDKLLENRR